MKKNKLLLLKFAFLISVIFSASNSYSTTISITAQNIVFTPATVSATVGDTIRWTWINGSHTTTCDGSSLTSRPAGAAPWNAALNSSTPTFKYVITVSGTYNYRCNPHGTSGMVGTINAAPLSVKLNLTSIIEGFWDGSSMVRDTVKIYLRNQISPYLKIDSASVKLNTSGNGLLTFLHAASGSYYIILNHRNSIETWSRLVQSFSAGVIKDYNFTSSANQAFGDNMILKSGKYTAYSGDINQDEIIDSGDLSSVENDLGNSGYIKTDLTGDDFTDAGDLSIVENNVSNGIVIVRP